MNKGVGDQYAVYEKGLFTFFCIVLLYVLAIFLISSVSVRFLPFQSFIKFILAWNVSLISPLFLKKSLLFLILLFSLFLCIVHLRMPSCLSLLFAGTLLSVEYIFPFLPCLFLLFFPQLFIKLPQTTNHFAFLYFFFCGMVLVTASCKMLWTAIHSYSGTLSTRSNPLNPFVTSTI